MNHQATFTKRNSQQQLPGGIHPPERKTLSNVAKLRQAPIPNQLVLPLNQHLGSVAKPIVTVGQKVLKGQQIAAAQGRISANVHASTSGTVLDIGLYAIAHPSNLPTTCIIIQSDGQDKAIDYNPIADPFNQTPETLRTAIETAGIIGLGGAGFPSAHKTNTQAHKPVHTLLLNAVECEPYITADDISLRERNREIITGCQLLCRASGATSIKIGIEDNKPEAIAALEHSLTQEILHYPVELTVVPTQYPSGGEKQLIQLLTGLEVPAKGLPTDLGLLCHNVGTAYAVYRAIELGEPLITRVTTLTGEALPAQARGNYEVRIGTPIKDLLTTLQTHWQNLNRLIMGGPMMGFTLQNLNVPVVKTTNCLIAATQTELPTSEPEQTCIRCGHCAEVCPASLLPQQLYWHTKAENHQALVQHNLFDCIECGACAYVCPSHIPLVQYYRFAKGEIRQHQAETTKSNRARQRFEARTARIEQAKAQREAQRAAHRKKVSDQRPSAKAQTSIETINDPEALKNAFLKAQKTWLDAQKALEYSQKNSPADTSKLEVKIEKLKTKAEQAKTQWEQAKGSN